MKNKYLWIGYWLLLFLLLIYPHVLDSHIFLLKRTTLTETIINFVIIFTWILIYFLHQQQIDYISNQKFKIAWDLEKTYKRMGVLNSLMDSLEDTIKRLSKSNHSQKEIIQRLLLISKKSNTPNK